MKRIIIVIVFSCMIISGCTNTRVSQNTNEIEIGSSVDLLSLLDYDKDNITVNIKDATKINLNEVGEYEVPFTIETKNGKITEKSFIFNVVDSTPPEIELEDPIVVYKDIDFDITQYVTCNDNSGYYDLTVTPEINTQQEGNTTVEIKATDKNGNTASKVTTVQVTQRATDFEEFCFGDTIETVKKLVGEENIIEEDTSSLSLNANTKLYGINTEACFMFAENDSTVGLSSCIYIFDFKNDPNKGYDSFQTVLSNIKNNYGEPNDGWDTFGSWDCTENNMEILLIYDDSVSQYTPSMTVGYYSKNMPW